jgi:hypothetical protein
MNSIEDFRAWMHDAVDNEPTSTVDTATVTSGALRRNRRRMAAAATGVAGIAVVALAASGQAAVTVATAPAASAPKAADQIPPINFQPPGLTWSTSRSAKFTTERGDSVELALIKAPQRAGTQAIVRMTYFDGTNPVQSADLGLPPLSVLVDRPVVSPKQPGTPMIAMELTPELTMVRTSHGTLVLGVVSTDTTSAAISPWRKGQTTRVFPATVSPGSAVRGKHLAGAKAASVIWTYLPDDSAQGASMTFKIEVKSPSGQANSVIVTGWTDVVPSKLDSDNGSTAPSSSPSATPTTQPSGDPTPTPSTTPSSGPSSQPAIDQQGLGN